MLTKKEYAALADLAGFNGFGVLFSAVADVAEATAAQMAQGRHADDRALARRLKTSADLLRDLDSYIDDEPPND